MSRPENPVWKVSICSVFTAIIAVSTVAFTVNIPATRGYFNIGESAIYLTAILFGRSIGGLSSGLGSMLADLILGYWLYAPATLAIKGLEGYIVGFLAEKEPLREIGSKMRIILVITAASAFTVLVLIVGVTNYVGLMEFSLATPLKTLTVQFTVPEIFWITLSIIFGGAIIVISLRFDPTLSWHILAVLLGGSVMVLGYFLYEQLILGVAAIVEIPINIGQVTIGSIISIPLVRALRIRLKMVKGLCRMYKGDSGLP
ncbi:MAG: ECF transporter S component [Candidatus Bathyarchaeia archaeon]